MNWRSLARKWHINLGLFATITLGLIAVSCFFMAPGQQRGAIGQALKEIHEGKFLPNNTRWVWIYGQGALLFWLIGSGFLIHRKAKKTLNAESPDVPGTSALILFGSETGNSEALARRFGDRAEAAGYRAYVAPLDSYDVDLLQDERWLFVITSTYGDGDMATNAETFWRRLSDSAMSKLPRLEFSVLALGDTNYEHFCAAGKKIDQRLEGLGAKRIYPRVDCDTDFDAKSQAWMDGVLAQLQRGRKERTSYGESEPTEKVVAESSPFTLAGTAPTPARAVASTAKKNAFASNGTGYSKKNPFPARMAENLRLTHPDIGKEVRHYQLDLSGSGLVYQTGDALGVQPTNCHDLVALTLAALGCDGEEGVTLTDGRETSLRRALLHHLDITKPSRDFLHALAERTQAPELHRILAPDANGTFHAFMHGREILDLLLAFPATFTPQEFVALLRPLAPRLYSIASSGLVQPDRVELTVATVRYESHGLPRRGVCSTFLAERVRGVSPVPVFVQPSPHFRLPRDSARPIIMVGPGTGIAPFRAFIQERQATGAPGKNWLFFGCQRRDADFLYRQELETWHQNGTLHRLDTAFSREGADKIYVQHRMSENGRKLWAWLQDGAHFYVCGDASRMAKDVEAALLEIATVHGGHSEASAREFLAQLKAEGRYQRDIY